MTKQTVDVAKEYDITATTAGTVTDQLFSHSCIAAPAGTEPAAVVIQNTADTVGGETIFRQRLIRSRLRAITQSSV